MERVYLFLQNVKLSVEIWGPRTLNFSSDWASARAERGEVDAAGVIVNKVAGNRIICKKMLRVWSCFAFEGA